MSDLQAVIGVVSAAGFLGVLVVTTAWKLQGGVRTFISKTLDEVITRNMMEVKASVKLDMMEVNNNLHMQSQRLDTQDKSLERLEDGFGIMRERMARLEAVQGVPPVEEAPPHVD